MKAPQERKIPESLSEPISLLITNAFGLSFRNHVLPPCMKIIQSLLVLSFLLGTTPIAFAKGKKDQRTSGTYGVAKFDVNENGVLDPDEIAALREAFAAGDTALQPLDVNNDGKLDDAEIAAIKLPPAEKKKKKKKKGAE